VAGLVARGEAIGGEEAEALEAAQRATTATDAIVDTPEPSGRRE